MRGKSITIDEMLGKKYGRLTVLREGPIHDSGIQLYRTVVCKCDCGNECTVKAVNLVYGGTRSCGCLNYKNPRKYTVVPGERHGALTFIEEVEPSRYVGPNSVSVQRRVKCKCDCGKEMVVNLLAAIHGQVTSCGCHIHQRHSKHLTHELSKKERKLK